MIDQLIAGGMHLVVGGVAANLLVIWSLVNVAAGGEGSRVSRERRLPQDSDQKLFGFLFAVGGICGLAVAVLSGFSTDWLFLAASAGLAFVVGMVVALPWVAKLNEQYLHRAASELELGNFKEALEDASEVARSSERLRDRANQIVEAAKGLRNRQPLSGF
jgi:hypothetical protein